MRTTIDIETGSYRLAKAIATQRGVSLGKIVAEAIQSAYGQTGPPTSDILMSDAGFPVLTLGRTITSEDVAGLEDE